MPILTTRSGAEYSDLDAALDYMSRGIRESAFCVRTSATGRPFLDMVGRKEVAFESIRAQPFFGEKRA